MPLLPRQVERNYSRPAAQSAARGCMPQNVLRLSERTGTSCASGAGNATSCSMQEGIKSTTGSRTAGSVMTSSLGARVTDAAGRGTFSPARRVATSLPERRQRQRRQPLLRWHLLLHPSNRQRPPSEVVCVFPLLSDQQSNKTRRRSVSRENNKEANPIQK